MLKKENPNASTEVIHAEKQLREKQSIKFRDAAISIRLSLTDTLKKLDDLCESLEIDLTAKPKVRRLTEKQLRHERCVAMIAEERRKSKIRSNRMSAKLNRPPEI